MFTVRNTLIAASLAALARAQSTPTSKSISSYIFFAAAHTYNCPSDCDPTDPTSESPSAGSLIYQASAIVESIH